ncbi:FAD-linked oxidase C-terminal domain-containing protein [Burkholderia plantarii]|uniref:FAD-linked oxidase C-terminal domain-containing protein n=1 Tax=Burkholderia plantarii TaxID=41899 RepID=UPI0007061CCB|nr:FAD-linked oxidase C-terminal domain-containing protein [Burkholderia plantarii]ALK29419.1 FAD linked oxidase-like protein [Burkholderia plantarii]GLZ21846.1 glycolate oxidase [Burkholderia plantarii]
MNTAEAAIHQADTDTRPDPASRAQRQREVVQALMAVLPGHCLLHRDEETAAYECDGLAAWRRLPLAVALPETESQVQRIVQICRRMNVPIVPRGAGTSLSGGALPHEGGIVVSLARFTRIVEVDSYARTATVQPGVRNLAISEAAAPYGLYYAPDPSSQIACTIGGNVAENSGGVHCLKYGLTVHNVLRVRAVTIDGDVVEFGSLALDTPGLDLLAVMIGSEGMFAIVTEVTVRLIPKPQAAQLVMASFDDVVRGGEAVAAIIAAGIVPAGLEMMDKPATQAVEAFTQAGYDLDAAAILLCESDGTPDEVIEEIARVTTVLQENGATRIQVSRSESERLRFWSGRKNAFPAAGRISPDYYCMDGTVPRRAIGPLLARIEQMEARYGLRCINVFHAGDGNMHPLILFDGNDPDQLHRAELFGAEILESCVELGGTVTGEHGVGVEKLNSMCVQFSPEERDAFLAVKRAFDPANLLNPDKGIPSRARCAEYGRLHVRGGLLPHPDLPRF